MPPTRVSKPREAKYGPRVPPCTWKKYSGEIRRLYIDKRLPMEGPEGLVEVMKRLHNFHANPGQYYTMFKEYKIAKNQKRHLRSLQNNAENETQVGISNQVTTAQTDDSQSGAKCLETQATGDHSLPTSEICQLWSDFTGENAEIDFTGDELVYHSPKDESPSWSLPGNNASSTYLSSIMMTHEEEPFFWHRFLDWDSMGKLVLALPEYKNHGASGAVYKVKISPLHWRSMQSLFGPSPGLSELSLQVSGQLMARYLVSALFNSMANHQQIDFVANHNWITSLQPNTVLQFFNKLPTAVCSIFRDRVLAAAIISDHADAVRLMLRLNPNLAETLSMPYTEEERTAIESAIEFDRLEVARIMIEHQCRTANVELLDTILTQLSTACFERRVYLYPRKLAEYSDLVRIPIDAMRSMGDIPRRIRLDKNTFWATMSDQTLLEWLLRMQDGFDRVWIEKGYLYEIVGFLKESCSAEASSGLIMTLQWINLGKLKPAITSHLEIQEALQRLVALPQRFHTHILQDLWSQLLEPESMGDNTREKHPTKLPRGLEKHLHEAIEDRDIDSISNILGRQNLTDLDPVVFATYIHKTMRLGEDRISIELISKFKYITRGTAILLACINQISEIVQLLCKDGAWRNALMIAHEQRAYHELWHQIFCGPVQSYSEHAPLTEPKFLSLLIAYHAIDINDKDLLVFTLEEAGACLHSVEARSTYRGSHHGGLPSLLAIAISRNRISMIEILLEHGSDLLDSETWQYVIRYGAAVSTIEKLPGLSASNWPPYGARKYGAAGCIEAIKQKNHDMLRLLMCTADVHSIVPLHNVSPLHQAVSARDRQAVQILLEHGANPNKLGKVYNQNRDAVRWDAAHSSILRIFTPILRAIDEQDMRVVRMLVESGALIEHPFKYCLLRSPLQRAAEIGNVEIVKYLLEKGAEVDFNQLHDSGTALQLAAIGGHVHLARLLLDHGASANAMPAQGQGRSALEGAAEWGRFDMILLLIKHGIDFDLPTGPNGEPQAARAIHFARKAGHGSLARAIDGLWNKWKDMRGAESPIIGIENWWKDFL